MAPPTVRGQNIIKATKTDEKRTLAEMSCIKYAQTLITVSSAANATTTYLKTRFIRAVFP